MSAPVETTTGHPQGTITVRIADIVRDGRFQVRSKLARATVAAYASAMKAGSAFPPVLLARIDGALALLDGFHRVQAAMAAGIDVIEADVITCAPDEAIWRAAEANLRHGLPLSRPALRGAFQAFMRARKYRKGMNRLLSLRDIALKLGGTVSHETVRRWLLKDFPKIAAHYSVEAQSGPRAEDGPSAADVLAETADQAVRNAAAAARGLTCPAQRAALAAVLEEALKVIRQGIPAGAADDPEPNF